VKVKLDENLPHDLVAMLVSLGHDAHSSLMESLGGRPDECIWNVAQEESRFLITQDLDFSDLRRYAPGTHHGVLIVRLANPSRRALIRRIEEIFSCEPVVDWQRCFVVVTDRKVRVRRPPV
jgi:predicted nuclease of predicted toxin-antitoxin system